VAKGELQRVRHLFEAERERDRTHSPFPAGTDLASEASPGKLEQILALEKEVIRWQLAHAELRVRYAEKTDRVKQDQREVSWLSSARA
jgi:hypothetical protein